jgi:copper chaperone NosL
MRQASLLLIVFFMACSTEPRPLAYGTDACHACKMILMDKKFGGEIVTKKGKIYVFDDTNCMVNFLTSSELEGEEIANTLIADYAQTEKLIPVEHTFFLKSDTIRSPMNSGIAAFGSETSMNEYKKKWKAIYLGWGEVKTEFK